MSVRRRVAGLTVAVAVVLLIAVTVWRVPFDPTGGGLRMPAAGDVLDADRVARGESYTRWARVWSLSSLVVSLVVAVALGLTRPGRDLVDRLVSPHRRGLGRWWSRVVLTVIALVVVGRVTTVIFAVLLHRRQRAYGLTDQGWSGFAADLVRTELLQILVTVVGALVFVVLVRRLPRLWPAVAGLVLGALVLLASLAYPLVVEPVFNRFTSLPDGPLRSGVLQLAQREGVQVDDVLVADASRRTTTLNAYVSGFGATRRVVLYDNLVDDLPPTEVLSVVAHELTHAHRDDVLTGSLLGALGALAASGLLGLVLAPGFAGAVGAKARGARSRPTARAEPTASEVARLLALIAVATVLVTPVQNAVSRRIEARADVGALTATRDPDAFIAVQRQLAARSVADLTPPPWWQWWFGSHPTTRQRIALALRLQDEGEGSPGRSGAGG